MLVGGMNSATDTRAVKISEFASKGKHIEEPPFP